MSANGSGRPTRFTSVSQIADGLLPIAARLEQVWDRATLTDEDRQDLDRLVLAATAGAYLSYVCADPARPTFLPLWNFGINMAGPNPDYVYLVADVDPAGTYRMTGHRGASRFVDIAQSGWVMLGIAREGEPAGPLPTHDLDSLVIDGDGRFSVVISAERPAAYEGDWWRLDPACLKLMVRSCACDWANEIDARLAIVRLDDVPAMSRPDLARRMANVPRWAEGIIGFDIKLAQRYRAAQGVNNLRISQRMRDGKGLAGQLNYDAWYEVEADEALIIDTAVPQTYRYWQMQVADDRLSTVDWVYRQSSLNDFQARIDSDGRFRAVISARDPGVPNWLDNAGNRCGILQMRLNRASSIPDPIIKRVRVEEVRDHVPSDTPFVAPDARQAALLRRAQAAQMRRLW
jgi:hypothetical protein